MSKNEVETNFSRHLKQFDGLSWLTLTPIFYDCINVSISYTFIQRISAALSECTEWRLNKSVLSSYLKLLLLRAGSLRLSGREFQTVGPATEKARRPSRWRGTDRWCRLAERIGGVGRQCLRLHGMQQLMASISASVYSTLGPNARGGDQDQDR